MTKDKVNNTNTVKIIILIPGPNGETRRSTSPSFFALSALTVLPVRAKSSVVGTEVRIGVLGEEKIFINLCSTNV